MEDEAGLVNDKRFGHYPIGQLSTGGGQFEIFFLHYHSEREATGKVGAQVQSHKLG